MTGPDDMAAPDDMADTAPPPASNAATGLGAVVDTRIVAHEKLPMLEVVCERMARAFSTALRNLSSEVVDVGLTDIGAHRFGDWMGELREPLILGVVRVEPWKNYGLIAFDTDLVYALIDALLGGRMPGGDAPAPDREFTSIEISLIHKVAALALNELEQAFASIAPAAFLLERMETKPRFAAVARPSDTAEIARFRLDMDGHGGGFSLLLPHATLEPARDRLVQRFMGEEADGENLWRSHMEGEILATPFDLEVVLGETTLGLGLVRALKPGQTIMLDRRADRPLDIRCAGIALSRGHAGQRQGRMAISLTQSINGAIAPEQQEIRA